MHLGPKMQTVATYTGFHCNLEPSLCAMRFIERSEAIRELKGFAQASGF